MTALNVDAHALTASEHQVQLRRAVIASTIGTAIEWYDFFLYSTVTGLVFAKLFFRLRSGRRCGRSSGRCVGRSRRGVGSRSSTRGISETLSAACRESFRVNFRSDIVTP